MADLLLELFSEEIPARMQEPASVQMVHALWFGLKELGYTPDDEHSETYVSPRHLAVIIRNIPDNQPDKIVERKGPRTGAPQAAIDGFLRSTGLTLDQLDIRGDTYFATIEQTGRPTAEVLPAMIERVLAETAWPKSMRWGAGTQAWVRPLHAIVCLLDREVLPVTFAGITAGNQTFGHRFLAPGPIALSHPNDYEQKLTDADVLIDAARRRTRIAALLAEKAAALHLTLKDDPGLLTEVTGLVEFPSVLAGRIDAAYMALPPEVLISEMREHQRYFALLDAEGRLADRFLLVSNMDPERMEDNGAAVVAGNERVLRARLADGKFFWEQDRKTSLAQWATKLDGMVFHARLGTMAQKVARVAALAEHIAPLVGADPALARQAAELCKADLPSGMVGEFPELQGVMGRYYAQAEGLPQAVADAIRDHYKPLGPTDEVPRTPISIAVALADKLDTLCGMFAIGEKPTGSKDPFALRRAALGALRIILMNDLQINLAQILMNQITHAAGQIVGNNRVSLSDAVTSALNDAGYNDIVEALHKKLSVVTEPDMKAGYEICEKAFIELFSFFHDRLKVMLKDEGIRHDAVEAVLTPESDDLLDIAARARALNAFLDTPDGANLLAGYKRAVNILRIEEKKDQRAYDAPVEAAQLAQPAEQALQKSLAQLDEILAAKLQSRDYAGAMAELARLRAPVDAFFEGVMVNDADPAIRTNRLNMLHSLRARMNRVASFERIQA